MNEPTLEPTAFNLYGTTDPTTLPRRFAGIDYSFRPTSYWEVSDPLQAILLGVEGEYRRQMITDFWQAGRIEELDHVLLEDHLSDQDREGLGRIHPGFMGGEYLPPLLAGEVEIARIILASVTTDIGSIRARPIPEGIAYRVVDEYHDEYGHHYAIHPGESNRPLSLGAFIQLLDGGERVSQDAYPSGLVFQHMIFNYVMGEPNLKEMYRFCRIESPYYPQLTKHYECVEQLWIRCEAERCMEDEEETADEWLKAHFGHGFTDRPEILPE